MKKPSSKKDQTGRTPSTKPFFEKNGNFFSQNSSPQSSFFSPPTIQTKLSIGQPNDPFEKEADAIADQVVQPVKSGKQKIASKNTQSQNMQTKPQIMKPGKKGGNQVNPSLANQLANSKGKGSPLSSDSNQAMSNKIGHDFNQVKVHIGEQAQQMNQSLNAKAFTHGADIYFNKGQYNPNSFAGKHLLAHELTHVVQQSGGHQKIQKQAAATAPPATPTPEPIPREDVVYVMGSDRAGFFASATRFYRARFPNATFVDNPENLHGILNHLTTNFSNPLGNIFIISHANEDGTLSSLRLDAADQSEGLTVLELRDALNPASGSSSLPTITTQVDDQTRIKIKGCDLGRNQNIVELIDQAFNGQGTVSAPTHEQGYDFSINEIRTASTQAMDEHMSEFEQNLPVLPPAPTAVNPELRGEERLQARQNFAEATRVHREAVESRREVIRAERTRFTPTAELLGEVAGTHEYMSGPMFQHQGTTLFTADDLTSEVARLYDHLSEDQREVMVNALVAPDERTPADVERDGILHQQGQRLYRFEDAFPFVAPQTVAQARIAFGDQFAANNFEITGIEISERTVRGETIFVYNFEGNINGTSTTMETESEPITSNQALINQVKAETPNPDKFAWRVNESQNSNGDLIKTVIRERVVCYLHHGNLDAAIGDRFLPPETDSDFFVESTFSPPSEP